MDLCPFTKPLDKCVSTRETIKNLNCNLHACFWCFQYLCCSISHWFITKNQINIIIAILKFDLNHSSAPTQDNKVQQDYHFRSPIGCDKTPLSK